MNRSGSVEGGEVTDVSGGGVVGHSAVGAAASSDDKRVPQINEAGPAINTQTQWSADININYSLDIMFQCEGCLVNLPFTGHCLHTPAAAAVPSPEEEGGVGAGLEPGRVCISPLTQSIVQQHPAAITKHLTRGLGVTAIAASSTHQPAPRHRVPLSVPHHGGQGAVECSGARTRGPQLHTSLGTTSSSSDQQPWNIIMSKISELISNNILQYSN